MPLSEREQRILRQIEEHLQRDHSMTRDTGPAERGQGKSTFLWIGATIVLLAAAVFGMTVHPLVGFVAFVAAVATALVAVGHVRQLAEQGLAGLAQAGRLRRPTGDSDRPRSNEH